MKGIENVMDFKHLEFYFVILLYIENLVRLGFQLEKSVDIIP